jgi:hypothetical protein
MSFPYVDFSYIMYERLADEEFSNDYGSIPAKPFSGSIVPDESFLGKNFGDSILDNPDDTNNGVPSVVDGDMGEVIVDDCPMQNWLDPKKFPDFKKNATDAFPVGDMDDLDMEPCDEPPISVGGMCKQAESIDPSVRINGITMLNFMFCNCKEDLFAKENIDMVKAAAVNMVASESPYIRDIGIKIACALWDHIEAMKKCIVRCNWSILNNA